MRTLIEIFKLLTDVQRIRILMLLNKKELSVCQLMGIIGASQPLVSRNLGLLYRGGFLDERRDGKLRFYSIRTDLAKQGKAVIAVLGTFLKNDAIYKDDMKTLKECSEFQKKTGKCDMKTLKEFMEWKKRGDKIRL